MFVFSLRKTDYILGNLTSELMVQKMPKIYSSFIKILLRFLPVSKKMFSERVINSQKDSFGLSDIYNNNLQKCRE